MRPTLVLLPGLGADRRLFAAQLAAFPDAIVPTWPDPAPDETLGAFAFRVEATLPSSPRVLVGSSFGGMVACEIAAHVRPRALVLVGSAAHPHAFPLAARAAARFAHVVPDALFAVLRVVAPALSGAFGARTTADRRVFAAMLRDARPSFLAWGARAMADWPGVELAGVDVHVVHGARDRVLPPVRVAGARIVDDAGHLLPLTHGDALNDVVAGLVDG